MDPRRPNTVNHHQLVYIPPGWLTPQNRHAGFFPIPEPYWPDTEATRLPTRNAQPTVHFHTKEEKSIDIPEGFPYDKYGVAPCPMTQELLTRPPGTCWPVRLLHNLIRKRHGLIATETNHVSIRYYHRSILRTATKQRDSDFHSDSLKPIPTRML